MAVNWDDVLINELLGDIFGKNEQDTAQFIHYLDNLSSLGISELCQEPEQLAEKYDQTKDMTRKLAFENYRTFITAADSCKQIYKDFNTIEEHLFSVLGVIPALLERAKNFSGASQETNFRLKQNSLVLSRHTQILEILEIPQVSFIELQHRVIQTQEAVQKIGENKELMDTCVRNGYYEEALELINYVKRLEKKLPTVKILLDIAKDVKKATQLMLEQLLLQLKGNVQLPTCLKIIGHIRQLEVFTEAQLRLKFLQSREAWLKSGIDSIPVKESYYHITKVIEMSRVHFFDIITQYRAIFSDDDSIFLTEDNRSINNANILHAWIGRKIAEFISVLDSDLDRGMTGRLDSILSQCMYFGLSFGRVGADFRGLLLPIFNKYVLQSFKGNLEIATKRFEESLATKSLANYSRSIESYSKTIENRAAIDTSLSPPQGLLQFPELAVYCNAVLTCFNELRHFTSIPLCCLIANVLKTSLQRVVAALSDWIRLELQSSQENCQKYISFLVIITVKDLLPYINRCFETVFKTSSLHAVFGQPRLSSKDSSNDVPIFDVHEIGAKLSGLLPEQFATDQGVDVNFELPSYNDSVEDSLDLIEGHDNDELMSRKFAQSNISNQLFDS